MSIMVINCILFNVLYTVWQLRNSRKINIFLVNAIASSYYIMMVPILGILGAEVVGFKLEVEGWVELIYAGTIYNAAMLCAQFSAVRVSKHNGYRIKPDLKMALLLWGALFLIYVSKYLYSGSLIFSEQKFLNILIFIFITLTVIIMSINSSTIKLCATVGGLYIVILMGFRSFILMILSTAIGYIIKHKYLLLIIPLFIPVSFIFENSRSYGSDFDYMKFIGALFEINILKYQDFIVNQGEASASLHSASILYANLKYENFYEPYIFAINKFLFIEYFNDPNEVLKNALKIDYSSMGFAFIHPVELYLQGGYIMIFMGGLLYGVFYIKLQDFIHRKFDAIYSGSLIAFASVYFGFYNYSRGYFFQIASGFFVIILVMCVLTIRFKLGSKIKKDVENG